MYVPEHFRESRTEVLYAFIARHPLATLVVRTATGLEANHIPPRSYRRRPRRRGGAGAAALKRRAAPLKHRATLPHLGVDQGFAGAGFWSLA